MGEALVTRSQLSLWTKATPDCCQICFHGPWRLVTADGGISLWQHGHHRYVKILTQNPGTGPAIHTRTTEAWWAVIIKAWEWGSQQ